ncbi:uncharacterized protein CANTADRAFT_141285 [Suhomyces tanzawaensis NRRL Y-17324]|uniref:Uncharacterized protein n=1 Tax=Suhomyces tanzawaensis NRRL Y-17324 TaxID=984487 RepID=A0A1E4SSI1_9ASCO|nr:uncharacterized protein CANTADRAFT_141285 [Suhomyces tanzawaensis NRRL Y-17324]ODV82352.1 hypothetical protein CANTADRAFT_141285 [Suhomyces tanzawaensis NRRL Y-17324]
MSQKDYRPVFAKGPSIPPIESFTLDRILNHTLKEEANQVIEQLLNVTSNYQDDLRVEIRKSLAMEQKIQYKNIQIAKLISSLNHQITRRRKKVLKVTHKSKEEGDNIIEDEVNDLLTATVETSSMIQQLAARMSLLEQRFGGSMDNYPNVTRILHKKESANGTKHKRPDPQSEATNHNENDTNDHNNSHETSIDYERPGIQAVIPSQTSPYGAAPVAIDLHGTSDQISNCLENDPASQNTSTGHNDSHSPSPPVEAPLPIQENSSSVLLEAAIALEPELKPEDFESFLSSSIYKYRQLQSNKYDAYDPFKVRDQTIPQKPKPTHNPLSLLYSSLINSPTYKDSAVPSHPFPTTISIKSPATIKLTLQTSHFKKLRINGSPITSDTFRKLQEQKEKESQESQGENNKQDNAQKKLEDLHDDTASSNGDLMLLDNLRLSSDDDTWGSSGLNTETEDDMSEVVEDPIASSDSSDSDSLKSGDDHISRTNKYYTSLQAQLKKKKVKGKKRKQREFETEASPTPKHQPSHHKLKPKRSILKAPRGVNPAPKQVQITTVISPETQYENERSGLAALNNAYDSGNLYEISHLTVTGTIVSPRDPPGEMGPVIEEDDRDDQSIRSLTRLKNYM